MSEEISKENTGAPRRIIKKTVEKPKEAQTSNSVFAKKVVLKKQVPTAKKKIFIKKSDTAEADKVEQQTKPVENKSDNRATTPAPSNNASNNNNSNTYSKGNDNFQRKQSGSQPPASNTPNAGQNNRGSTNNNNNQNRNKPGSQNKPRTHIKDDKMLAARKQEERLYNKLQEKKRSQEARLANVSKEIDIMETVVVGDLAKKMNLRASDIISKLMSMGSMVRVNDMIDSDTATILAEEFHCKVNVISLKEETQIEIEEDKAEDLKPRSPIVTIMGHVDHGKTSLLDVIRKTNVVAKESGGITQNIGAYKVKSSMGEIAFIDTPGHAAFTKMRLRGATSTDIVILVVAADDGVMPQTIEAINHAQLANVPIIVAVNKIDLVNADREKIKAQLTEYNLMPEEWGGDTQYVYVSAHTKEGVDDLLEAISLQAELLELKANPKRDAFGVVLESSLSQSRGAVATILVQNGTLRIGDYFVCGLSVGKVRAMIDDKGQRVESAIPSTPVEVLGFEKTPEAGEDFNVLKDEQQAKSIAEKRKQLKQQETLKANVKVNLENLFEHIENAAIQEFNVIIKADVQGSAEALRESLSKIQSDKIRFVCIHAASGAVNESDVDLASVSGATIIAYRVRPSGKAKELAEKLGVAIEKYDIIYEAIESIQNAMRGALSTEKKDVDTGTAEVREVFRIPKVGSIAGCYVTSGKIERNSGVRIIRAGVVIYTSKIGSLKRIKEDAKEVVQGYECGIGIENFNDLKEGDVFEVYKTEEFAQEL